MLSTTQDQDKGLQVKEHDKGGRTWNVCIWMCGFAYFFVLWLSVNLGCSQGGNGLPGSDNDLRDYNMWCSWEDVPQNPLIAPLPSQRWPNSLLADPTVIIPHDSPDGMWHLFAHSLKGIHHFISHDGITWDTLNGEDPLFQGMRPYIYFEAGVYYMLYERITRLFPLTSCIELRFSENLLDWSQATTILEPTLDWERSDHSTTTGNPFIMKRDGLYWLYYSANGVYLPDCVYLEPLYIGLARSPNLFGPYLKEPSPLIGPSQDDPYHTLGAGSIKVLPEQWNATWVAFNNGIYQDSHGKSRSAICVLGSHDGLVWDYLCPEPVITPGDTPWKKAFVYAFDVKKIGTRYWMYYNARDGWLFGTERIGLAILTPSP